MNLLENFSKKHDYLICIDSDGCAIDSMDIKHINCFGPCIIDEWQLQKYRDEILKKWNEINLYSMTRGINRFLGLAKILRYINDNITQIEDVTSLEEFVKHADELSNASVEKEVAKNGSLCLSKSLSWSQAVNKSIKSLPQSLIKPFEGVKEKLEKLHEDCDIAIVSSANYEAVLEEWEKFDLMCHVDILLAQNVGSKKSCIEKLLSFGYDRKKTMMTGDAPGDLEAATKNGVCYYPILVKHEKESWDSINEAVQNLQNGTFDGEYQQKLIEKFKTNLA